MDRLISTDLVLYDDGDKQVSFLLALKLNILDFLIIL